MPRFVWLCGGGLLIIVIVLVWWCWRPCPPCPPVAAAPAAPAATIVLEDMHTAAWMPIDNGFIDRPGQDAVCKPPTPTPTPEQMFGKCAGTYTEPDVELRTGVLLQIGQLQLASGKENNFKDVVLTQSVGGPVTLDKTMFDWLDVEPVGTSCAIDALNAYSLFQGATHVVTTQCDGVTLVPATAPSTCLRARGIQAGLLPDTAIVTYWSGNGHYKVERQNGGHSFQYTFSLNDPVTVDRWLAGCFQERYDNVTEIRIRYGGDIQNHQGFPHSPMDGGTIVPDPPPGP